MSTPNTNFIVVRGPGYPEPEYVKIIKNDGAFDLSQHSFWKVEEVTGKLMEDWVPTVELEMYKSIQDPK